VRTESETEELPPVTRWQSIRKGEHDDA
jgi:hypothetical protein